MELEDLDDSDGSDRSQRAQRVECRSPSLGRREQRQEIRDQTGQEYNYEKQMEGCEGDALDAKEGFTPGPSTF